MLVIRLTRMGKTNEAAYRLVLAEKSAAVKGAYQEALGFYNPSDGKKMDFKKERIEYWISKGARPSDTVASLLKTNGMSGMEGFLAPRNKNRRSKSAPTEEAAAPAAVATPELPSAPAETPAEATVPASEAA